MKIFVEEEYGYRYWLWDYPHTQEQLLLDWKAGRAPLDFFDPRNSRFDGSLTKIEDLNTAVAQGWDAYIHTHEPSDTYLKIRGNIYPQDPEKWEE